LKKYGDIKEEIRIHKGFSFVQYDNPKSAKEAIESENGRFMGNKRIDLSLAKGTKAKRKLERDNKKKRNRNKKKFFNRRNRIWRKGF